MRSLDRRQLLPRVAAAFVAALLVGAAGPERGRRRAAPRAAERVVDLQLLGVNDFHGHLEPPNRAVGGAAWLGAHLARAARSHPGRTITVHAGDMIGASPLASSHFQDEPAIEATNMMGFDVGAVGNHEFDEGGDGAHARAPGARATVAGGQHGRSPRPARRCSRLTGVTEAPA